MQKKSYRFRNTNIFLVLLSLYLATGCQREVHDGPGGGNTTGGVDDNIIVVAGVRGIVVDENSQPVEGAVMTSGSNTTSTDRYGVFRFNNINLSKSNGYVKAVKQGYFTGSRSFVTTAGRIHNIRIKLLPKTNNGSFTATAGGVVTLSSGGKLTMPANAVIDNSGNAYTGTVNVAMTWIDPSASNLPEIIVGDLRGITTSGEERGLQTFGMLGVEMTGSTGQVLKIASGKTAELTFPIPASLLGSAPANIDLWHFDEVKGRWIQEGTAVKTGNNYVAQVSHFSFWNCDAPFPLINLCMTLVNAANSQPLINVQVRIKRTNGSYGYGWTDSTGNLCGKVPKNEALVLEVIDQCNTVAYSQNIGPFSADASLGIIAVTLPATNTLTITGTITDCNNANVTNGSAIIYTGGTYSYTAPVTNGNFSVTIVRCSGGTLNFSVVGIDNIAMQQSVPVSGSGTSGIVNVGTIQACGTSSIQFADYIIDGVSYHFSVPPDQFNCPDSTGSWGAYSKKTMFYGFKGGGGIAIGSLAIYFPHNEQPGTFPLHYARMQYTANVQALQLLGANPVVNITAFGSSGGGFIEGNYTELMDLGGTQKIVNCNFRIRRN